MNRNDTTQFLFVSVPDSPDETPHSSPDIPSYSNKYPFTNVNILPKPDSFIAVRGIILVSHSLN